MASIFMWLVCCSKVFSIISNFTVLTFLEFSQGLVLPTKTTSNSTKTTSGVEISKVHVDLPFSNRNIRISGNILEMEVSKMLSVCYFVFCGIKLPFTMLCWYDQKKKIKEDFPQTQLSDDVTTVWWCHKLNCMMSQIWFVYVFRNLKKHR